MSKPSNDTADNANELERLTVDELMERLDEIVEWFGGDKVDLDQATQKFDQGAELAEVIKHKLTEAENKVNQIKLRLDKINEGE